jgi:probable HAF family extracellular repeat protein
MKTIDNCSIRSLVMAVALSIGLGFVTHASAQFEEHSYLIDLKAKTGTDLGEVQANAINDAGQVAGASSTAGGFSRAFITGPNGVGMIDLGTLPGGDHSYATSINDAGQVAGYSYMADGTRQAFITGPNGMGMRALGTGGSSTAPGPNNTGINNAGQVAGTSDGRAFITGPNGLGMRDLGSLGGGTSWAYGINDAGQVVGWSYRYGGGAHAFITGPNGVGMTELGTLSYSAFGINDTGQVVGDFGSPLQGFITGPNGMGMTQLGRLTPGGQSIPNAINDAGQVVGFAHAASGDFHAFITGPNGAGMTDLNSLVHLPHGALMDNALAINNMGQVLVTATIPEPESYALMLAGLLLTGVMVRRKQKADRQGGSSL